MSINMVLYLEHHALVQTAGQDPNNDSHSTRATGNAVPTPHELKVMQVPNLGYM